MSTTTTFPNPADSTRQWVIIDAKDQILGRLASRIVMILRGKHKPSFTPFFDNGDGVVVINAAKMAITGRKLQQQTHKRYSGYPGGLRSVTIDKIMDKNPDRVLRQAVKGMMPNGPLSRSMMRKLKIYRGETHRQIAQRPTPVNPVKRGT